MAASIINPFQSNPNKNQAAYVGSDPAAFDFWGAPVYTSPSTGDLYCPGFTGNTFAANAWDKVGFVNATSSITDPILAPSLLNILSYTPGLCDVTVVKEAQVDEKKAAGGHGARLTVHGIKPAQIGIRILIWTPQQLKELKSLWDYLFGSSPLIVYAHHPIFDVHHIAAIQIIGGSGPEAGSSGQRTFNIRAIEYLKPSPPKKSVTKTEKPLPSKYDPNASESTPLPSTKGSAP